MAMSKEKLGGDIESDTEKFSDPTVYAFREDDAAASFASLWFGRSPHEPLSYGAFGKCLDRVITIQFYYVAFDGITVLI
ncbi:hypothetical protein E8E13_005734 [Curvularia kusanoi]|uniref:Uncharacterized protein n=1 Tax=Curvularia kusanoi TaxID=90978 RepID=A0A9P4TFN6_CURKU|nr:hypothetical protein E8E13_005734 [Curvularia kusanoi]